MNTTNTNTQVNDQPTRRLTIKEFANVIGEDYPVASALVGVMVKIGAAKEVGKRAMPAGVRGKPSTEYEIPQDLDLRFWGENEVGNEAAEPLEVNQPVETLEVTPTSASPVIVETVAS